MASATIIIYSLLLIWIAAKSTDLAIGIAGEVVFGLYATLMFVSTLWISFATSTQGNYVSRLIARLQVTPSWQQEVFDLTSGITISRSIGFLAIAAIYLWWQDFEFWHVISFLILALIGTYSAVCIEVEFYTGKWKRYILRSIIRPVSFIFFLIISSSLLLPLDALVGSAFVAGLIEFAVCSSLGGAWLIRSCQWRPSIANERSAIVDILSTQSDRLFSIFAADAAFFASTAILAQLRIGLFSILKPVSRNVWLCYLERTNYTETRIIRFIVFTIMILATTVPQRVVGASFDFLGLSNLGVMAAPHFETLIIICACAFACKKELAELVLLEKDRCLLVANSVSAISGMAVMGYGIYSTEINVVLIGIASRYFIHKLIIQYYSFIFTRCWTIDSAICLLLIGTVLR